MNVRKTSVEIREELLAAFQRVLSTATLRGKARREEVEALSTMSGMDLMDPDIMSRAWRL